MTQFQEAKARVRAFHDALETGDPARALADAVTPDYHWRGYHPFYELSGAEAVAETFWRPLTTSLTSLQRREDIFFAGLNEIDGFSTTWVVSMGHFMGLFDAPWLGIRPTRRLTFLRYAEFNRIEGDRIAETALYIDIPHLMAQAGQDPFGPQTAAFMVQPGPRTHDGLLHGPQPEAEGVETLRAINAMVGDLGTWGLGLPIEEELARTWDPRMIWWGPHGIGATYTIPRYAEQHAGPFRASMAERSKTRHIARLAEGSYGGFFGWPNFTTVHTGGFMGMPASPGRGEMRVIDIYRRQGTKLVENWVFIDLLHFWKTLGVDILGRFRSLG